MITVTSVNTAFSGAFSGISVLPDKWTVVFSPPLALQPAMRERFKFAGHTWNFSASGPWRHSKKSDEMAKIHPESALQRHTKAYGNINWASTAQKWKLILSRSCVVNTYSRSPRTPPKAVPTCEGNARSSPSDNIYWQQTRLLQTRLFMHIRCALFSILLNQNGNLLCIFW